MLAITQSESDLILSEAASRLTDSNLGYFSKPFRINFRNSELMLKKYYPVRNPDIVSKILQNHERYISALSSIGIRVPDTIIRSVKIKGKYQIFILQEAFRKDEMLRTRFENSPEDELPKLCKLIYDDVQKFLTYPKVSMDIGFHPTLRNYALHNDTLFFFDTFPPMLMKQRDLNRIIIRMSPYGSFFKVFIPERFINLVTDEYYNFEKMFIGITGSCCRLRPENANAILDFSTGYINNSTCSPEVKQNITRMLKTPPELPGIWTFIRKLSGNVGKPNIKKL